LICLFSDADDNNDSANSPAAAAAAVVRHGIAARASPFPGGPASGRLFAMSARRDDSDELRALYSELAARLEQNVLAGSRRGQLTANIEAGRPLGTVEFFAEFCLDGLGELKHRAEGHQGHHCPLYSRLQGARVLTGLGLAADTEQYKADSANPPVSCWHCGEQGHTSRDCPAKPKQKCFGCGKVTRDPEGGCPAAAAHLPRCQSTVMVRSSNA